mgnify:CR=1 FL=1
MENNEKEKKEKTGWVAELISWVQVLVFSGRKPCDLKGRG